MHWEMMDFGKKSGVRGTKWGKGFQTKKGFFQTKQVHLATFLAMLKLKAEKQQQESMQAKGQSSSFIVPREAEDMIRNQPQALSQTYCSHSANIFRTASPPAKIGFHTAASTRILYFRDSDQPSNSCFIRMLIFHRKHDESNLSLIHI